MEEERETKKGNVTGSRRLWEGDGGAGQRGPEQMEQERGWGGWKEGREIRSHALGRAERSRAWERKGSWEEGPGLAV